jgi:predicted phosphoadenosine phosphosulfate sulfurtransferase
MGVAAGVVTKPKYGRELGKPSLVQPKVQLDADVWTLALERTRYLYRQFDHVAVSFSGGKDSTATLQVALEVAHELGRLPLDVVFYDEEAIPPETVEYARRVAERPDVSFRWECLPVRHRNACSVSSPEWSPWAPEVRELWCRELPPEAITTGPDFPEDPEARPSIPEYGARLFDPGTYGNVVELTGMRAAESLMRARAVRKHKGENFIVKDYHGWDFGNVWFAYPIYDWSTADVWRAPARMGWDYNRAYDVMEMLGLTPHQQRCAPPYGEEPIKKLWVYQQGWPELWDKMSMRVPGAAAAARYGESILYGVGGLPVKPDDLPWETFVLGLLERTQDADLRASIAHRIRADMRRHYAKSSDPIVFDAPHPVTGLNWKYLVNLAIRADAKHRRGQGFVSMDPVQREKAWAKYRAELAAGGDVRQQVRP